MPQVRPHVTIIPPLVAATAAPLRQPGESIAHFNWRVAVWKQAAKQKPFRRRGLGAVDITVDPTAAKPWYADILEKGLAIYQSEQVRREQKRRIEQGLPPLTDAQILSLWPTNTQWSLIGPLLIGALLISALLIGGPFLISVPLLIIWLLFAKKG